MYVLTHLSHFGMLYNCYQEGNSYEECDKEMLKPLLILTLLKIISRNQRYINVINNRYYITLYTSSCIESNTITCRIVLAITKVAVFIDLFNQVGPFCGYPISRRTVQRYLACLVAVTAARNSAWVLGVAVVDWVLEGYEITLKFRKKA